MLHGSRRPFFWIAPLVLLAMAEVAALNPLNKPTNLTDALLGALAFVGIFSLGAVGLAILRGPRSLPVGPPISALLFCVVSLVRAHAGVAYTQQLGVLDGLFAAGLVAWALRLGKTLQPPPESGCE